LQSHCTGKQAGFSSDSVCFSQNMISCVHNLKARKTTTSQHLSFPRNLLNYLPWASKDFHVLPRIVSRHSPARTSQWRCCQYICVGGDPVLALIDLAVAFSLSIVRSQVLPRERFTNSRRPAGRRPSSSLPRSVVSHWAVKRTALSLLAEEGMLASHTNHSWLSGVSVNVSPPKMAV
jgi:hypothetical protein